MVASRVRSRTHRKWQGERVTTREMTCRASGGGVSGGGVNIGGSPVPAYASSSFGGDDDGSVTSITSMASRDSQVTSYNMIYPKSVAGDPVSCTVLELKFSSEAADRLSWRKALFIFP